MSTDPHLGDKTTKINLKDIIIMHHNIHLCQEGGAMMKVKNVGMGWLGFGCLQSSVFFLWMMVYKCSLSVSLLSYTFVFHGFLYLCFNIK